MANEDRGAPAAVVVEDLRDRLARCEESLALERAARAEADRRATAALCLFAAAWRLGEAATEEQVYAALDEIAGVLFETRDLAVLLAHGPDHAEPLRVAHAAGQRAPAGDAPPAGYAAALRAVCEGVVVVHPSPDGSGCEVAVPLVDRDAAVGALVLYGVGHRRGATGVDQLEAMEILGRQAGRILGTRARRPCGPYVGPPP